MKTLKEVTEFMIDPGDEKKPWLVTAMISHCKRLAQIHKIKATPSEVAQAVKERLEFLAK